MLVEITHTTRFSYENPIEESTVEAWLSPCENNEQRRYQFSLEVQPHTPTFSYGDGFGNAVHFFNVLPPHRALTVTARSRVETLLANPFAAPERPPAEPHAADLWPFLQFGGPVLPAAGVDALARRFRPGDREGTLDALQGLMREIRETFEYEAEVTTVSSTVEDLLSLRKGVCQDFAHLMIAVCRAMQVPARYASGYIVNRPDRAARGAAASHAWCEAWVPG
jgi:transglutaminase-like putative cysteine protease